MSFIQRMHKYWKLLTVLALVTLLSACAPERRLVKPIEKMAAPYDNGSIFKVGFNERPLYEERRARNVGDGLILNVPESAIPVKKPVVMANGGKSVESDREARKNKRKEDGHDEYLSLIDSDALVGTIPMTVMEIMDNGFMFVYGGKMVTIDEEDKYVRITGVVDPTSITGGNIVLSTLMSDVNIEIDAVRILADGTVSHFSEGQSTFANFFQSMRP